MVAMMAQRTQSRTRAAEMYCVAVVPRQGASQGRQFCFQIRKPRIRDAE